MTVAILDLGYGNVQSVRLGFERLGVTPALVRDAESVVHADYLVVPGVGHAGYAMRKLEEHGLTEPICQRKAPTLGICVGMQLLFETSEECAGPLLGILPGKVAALEAEPSRPVPHMGWSKIISADEGIGLVSGDYLYFAHSFACPDSAATTAKATYGRTVPAAVRRDNFWGAQFHPERSSKPGTNFMKAFLSS